ncbi:MAG: DUF5067 domain-containing protein [Oscillospiraceae bacterium]|nr:DUF5067 domain-containing protein [Oscillospiraceae bacterium]
MKKLFSLVLAIILIFTFGVFALGSGESETTDQGKGSADSVASDSNLGEYTVEIKSCRLAKDYEGKAVVIVKYGFTNNSDEATAFYTAFEDEVYQKGVGLNGAYVLADSANYNSDNQTKAIKKGASIDVEVAYELNDNTTDIEVEVKELFSFDDSVVTKTFSIKK